MDSPVSGPADVVSGVLLLGGLLVRGGIATYTAVTAPTPSISIPKAEEKEEVLPAPPPGKCCYNYDHGGYDWKQMGKWSYMLVRLNPANRQLKIPELIWA